MTSDADRRLLLQVARDAIVAHVAGTQPAIAAATELLELPGGAFVTIHKGGELRGCIGHIEANEPLGRVIARCAVAACSCDPRFASCLPGSGFGDLLVRFEQLDRLPRHHCRYRMFINKLGMRITSQ